MASVIASQPQIYFFLKCLKALMMKGFIQYQFSGWRFPHTSTPQVPNQHREVAGGSAFSLLLFWVFFPPLICTAGRSLFWNIFSFILWETSAGLLGWGILVYFCLLFFKKKAICLNFSLHSLPLRFTLEKLNYKKYNKYLLNWWKQ